MVIIAKALVFEILKDSFWNKPLDKENLACFVNILEDKLGLSFQVGEKEQRCLKALLFRLRKDGLRAKIKGGAQFKKFQQDIALSKYSWDVAIKRHESELKVEQLKEKYEEQLNKVTDQKRDVESRFVEFVKSKQEEKRVLLDKVSNLEEKLVLKSDGQEVSNIPLKKRKTFAECSKNTRIKRKQNEKEKCLEALKFLEDDGCVPISVTVNRSGKQEVIQLYEKANEKEGAVSGGNLDNLNTLLYIIDTFNISQSAYHELSMLFKTLPRTHSVQEYKAVLNSEFTIINTPDGLGVQQSLKSRLVSVLSQLMIEEMNFESSSKITIKLSGDGTRIGKRIHVVNVTFTVLNSNNCGSANGNYPLCIIKTEEKYEYLHSALANLRQEVEELQGQLLKVDDREFSIEILLGGDYKFLLVCVGISSIAAHHSCIYCKCSKTERHDLTKVWSMSEESKGARVVYMHDASNDSLPSKKSRNKKAQNFSVTKIPLFQSITPSRVVVDHLHMFLRISDKLFRLLVEELRTLDNISANTTFNAGLDRSKTKHIAKLETILQQLGIQFELYINKDSRKLEYRDLNGPEKLKHMEKFDAHDLFDDAERGNVVQRVWDTFYALNNLLKSKKPSAEDVSKKADEWCCLFVDTYQSRDFTPYMHVLKYHVPELIQHHGNIVQFTQQGLEKLNDVVTKQFFRSSNHKGCSALKQVMEKQNRLCKLEKFRRRKRKYCRLANKENEN